MHLFSVTKLSDSGPLVRRDLPRIVQAPSVSSFQELFFLTYVVFVSSHSAGQVSIRRLRRARVVTGDSRIDRTLFGRSMKHECAGRLHPVICRRKLGATQTAPVGWAAWFFAQRALGGNREGGRVGYVCSACWKVGRGPFSPSYNEITLFFPHCRPNSFFRLSLHP